MQAQKSRRASPDYTYNKSLGPEIFPIAYKLGESALRISSASKPPSTFFLLFWSIESEIFGPDYLISETQSIWHKYIEAVTRQYVAALLTTTQSNQVLNRSLKL
ncbi:unnamed protein product [Rhizoctonia solani]|uniref:Uncharacterized protein n=1 Tax=Rhizoctonia solani TaxID=456999 RepID=A0A8H3B5S4_9AGAM|nr:unnamed protein product [Rhizoctonia solani]